MTPWVRSWKLTGALAAFFAILGVLALLSSTYDDRPYLDSVLWFLVAALNAFLAVVEYRRQRIR